MSKVSRGSRWDWWHSVVTACYEAMRFAILAQRMEAIKIRELWFHSDGRMPGEVRCATSARAPFTFPPCEGQLRGNTVELAVNYEAHGFQTLPPYEGGIQGGSSPSASVVTLASSTPALQSSASTLMSGSTRTPKPSRIG